MMAAVLVVGAGPAGSALACYLARRGHSVVVISHPNAAVESRELLPAAALAELARLGWTEHVAKFARPVFATRAVWAGDDWETSSLMDALGEGWNVDREKFADLARDLAAAVAGVRLVNTRAHSIGGIPGDWIVQCAGLEVRARHLVDATGRNAWLGRRLGAQRIVYDRLVGLVASMQADSVDPVLCIESVPDGWFYSLPTENGLSVTYMTDLDTISRGRRRMLECFCTALLAAPVTRNKVSEVSPISVQARPAGCGFLAPAGPGWTAVGDAAEAWDPLSGSGLLRALRSARLAADRIHLILRGCDASVPSTNTFAQHLNLRRQYYEREPRWRTNLFWDRRCGIDDDTIRLRPEQTVMASNHPPPVAAHIESLVAPRAIHRLVQLCKRPRPAHDVLTRFREDIAYPGDRTAVVVLQELIKSDLVCIVGK